MYCIAEVGGYLAQLFLSDAMYTYVFLALIVVMIVGFAAQSAVRNAYIKYSRVSASPSMTADELARQILKEHNSNVSVIAVDGELTDHYNPKTQQVCLGKGVYGNRSIAAFAIAAHEVGHVLQHEEGYFPIIARNTILPVASIGSRVSPFIVIIGIFMGSPNIALFGAILFSAVFLFQLITLPVEFNASARALELLQSSGQVDIGEEIGAKKVLRAAAMTYVVAALASLLSLVRLLLIARRSSRD